MLTIFGDLERFLSEDLYPYRYPITIALVLAIIVGLAIAIRLKWYLLAWRNKVGSGLVAAIIIPAAIVGGNYFLSPLWERSTVCEASPIAGAGSGSTRCADSNAVASTTSPTAPQPTRRADAAAVATRGPTFEARVARQGEFQGADDFHFGRGKALLIETATGVYTLRFEDFSVRNGPALVVLLSPDPSGYADNPLKLGELKGTDGAFNYEIPSGADVSPYQSAIIWCDAFDVLFAVAPLAGSS